VGSPVPLKIAGVLLALVLAFYIYERPKLANGILCAADSDCGVGAYCTRVIAVRGRWQRDRRECRHMPEVGVSVWRRFAAAIEAEASPAPIADVGPMQPDCERSQAFWVLPGPETNAGARGAPLP